MIGSDAVGTFSTEPTASCCESSRAFQVTTTTLAWSPPPIAPSGAIT